MDFYTFTISANFFDCEDLKTGGRDIGILWTIYKFTNTFLPGSNSSFVGGKIYGLLRDFWQFGILVKNFNNKIVITTNNNNAQITRYSSHNYTT